MITSDDYLLLHEIAVRILKKPPSQIDDTDIYSAENVLNSIYKDVSEEKRAVLPDVENAILKILGLAGYLSSTARGLPKEQRSEKYFSGVKKLAKLVLALEFLLESQP